MVMDEIHMIFVKERWSFLVVSPGEVKVTNDSK